jgi:hypothetical protein
MRARELYYGFHGVVFSLLTLFDDGQVREIPGRQCV